MNIKRDSGQPETPGADPAPTALKHNSSKKGHAILVAARSLFLSHGFAAVSMELIARVSKTSKATVYAHFKTKEALFMSILELEIQRVNSDIMDIDYSEKDIRTSLRQIAVNFVEVGLTDQMFQFQRMVVGSIPQLPALGPTVYHKGPMTLVNALAAFFARAQADGILRTQDPILAAKQLLNLIRLDLDHQGMLAVKLPPKAQLEIQTHAAIEMFLRYYLQE